MNEFQDRGSGWPFIKVKHLELLIKRHSALNGSSYIEMPEKKLKANKQSSVCDKRTLNASCAQCYTHQILEKTSKKSKQCKLH